MSETGTVSLCSSRRTISGSIRLFQFPINCKIASVPITLADIGCYDGKTPTPNIDQLAKEGVRFTDFYAAQPVCSASRASLITGCYPNRVGIFGALGPDSGVGISDKELTLPQMLKKHGYATGMVGKWHLGCEPEFMPNRRGFDEFFGIPYSGDMWPYHPTYPHFPPLPLYENEKVINASVQPADQEKLAAECVEHSLAFIEKNKERPFFLYFASNFPHVPLFAGAAFKGKTGLGLYSDVISEIDWSVGQVVGALKKDGILDNPIVIFSSDNGPWLRYGNHAGSAKPWREGKGTTFEGGMREPFIVRYPPLVPAGTVQHEPAMTTDIMPTIAAITGATLSDNKIDGKDIRPLLAVTAGAKTPHEAFWFYYYPNGLEAIRMGNWKLMLPHVADQVVEVPGYKPGHDGKPGRELTMKVPLSLFDLKDDPHERHNVADAHPDIVAAMQKEAERARADLGDSILRRKGSGERAPGKAQ
jgi:arylsulfatase A-like enzyme